MDDRHSKIAELAYQRHQRHPSASAEENWAAASAEYSANLASPETEAAEILAARNAWEAAPAKPKMPRRATRPSRRAPDEAAPTA